MRWVFAGLLSAMLIGAASAEDCVVAPPVKAKSASEAITRCGAVWNAQLKCDRARADEDVSKPAIKRTRLGYRCFMYGCLGSNLGQLARGTSACPIGQPQAGRS